VNASPAQNNSADWHTFVLTPGCVPVCAEVFTAVCLLGIPGGTVAAAVLNSCQLSFAATLNRLTAAHQEASNSDWHTMHGQQLVSAAC
jgi:hypothetical protein